MVGLGTAMIWNFLFWHLEELATQLEGYSINYLPKNCYLLNVNLKMQPQRLDKNFTRTNNGNPMLWRRTPVLLDIWMDFKENWTYPRDEHGTWRILREILLIFAAKQSLDGLAH